MEHRLMIIVDTLMTLKTGQRSAMGGELIPAVHNPYKDCGQGGHTHEHI